MIFDKEKNKDISELKKLSKLKDKKLFEELRERLMKKYNCSRRTIYYWLQQRTPGARKMRADSGKARNPVTSKERKIAEELIEQGKEIKEVKKIVSEKTGKPVSDRKLARIRSLTDDKILNDDTEPETNFGDVAKEVFRKLFECDLIAPGRGLGITVHGKKFSVPKEDLEDICLILANAYNRTNEVKYKIDRNELLKRRIFHLIEQQVRLATSEKADTKTIESITRMYDKMLVNVEIDANIRVVEKVCKELKPDISFEDIVALIKKHSDTE